MFAHECFIIIVFYIHWYYWMIEMIYAAFVLFCAHLFAILSLQW